MFKIVYLSDAAKAYARLLTSDRSHFDRIFEAIEGLRSDPYSGKPLRHEFKGSYSLRVGMYRVLYRVDRQVVTIYIINIGHRREVYR